MRASSEPKSPASPSLAEADRDAIGACRWWTEPAPAVFLTLVFWAVGLLTALGAAALASLASLAAALAPAESKWPARLVEAADIVAPFAAYDVLLVGMWASW